MSFRIVIGFVFISALLACQNERKQDTPVFEIIQGKTMGTTYSINYEKGELLVLKQHIDSILLDINMGVSTYIKESSISRINNAGKLDTSETGMKESIQLKLENNVHFTENFRLSEKYYEETNGFFDPTVMPLVNYWGFGYKDKKAVNQIDSSYIEGLVRKIGMNNWSLLVQNDSIIISKPIDSELDFSAIAKGYAVDYLSSYLAERKIQNFMVEIGGEVYCSGKNKNSEAWSIGLSKPETDARPQDFSAILKLSNSALASSGNYRNYYDENGYVYGHEINPHTGFPEINSLLGVSVKTSTCSEADALATAFMVMGLERSMEWLESNNTIDVVFFYRTESNSISYYMSPELENSFELM